MRAFLVLVCLVIGGCSTPCDEVVFPGWDRIPAVSAAAYCEERGAELVEVPTTEAEIATATDACRLADAVDPCWVGEPVDGVATVVTVDGYVLEFEADVGPALALCRMR